MSETGKGDTASYLGSFVYSGLSRAEIKIANWTSDALGDQTVMIKTIQSSKRLGERQGEAIDEQRQ